MEKIMINFKIYFRYINLSLALIFSTSCDNEESRIDDTENENSSEFIGLNNISTTHDNLNRSYQIYVPATYSVTEPIPLVFNLHGGASTATGYLNSIGDMRPIADTANFIIIYPQATIDSSGNPTWHLGGENSKSTSVDDVGFVSHIIDEVSSIYSVDLERVYVTGFSNGGYLAYEIACLLSNRIAGIGSVAGHMFIDTYNYCDPSHPTPVINIHGTEDFYEGIAGYYLDQNLSNRYWTEYNNTDTDPVITYIENTNTQDGSTVELHSWLNGDNGISVVHYKVMGGGHSYPNLNPSSSKGYENGDIDSNSEIWNFLSRYDINGLR
ncbi:MAG: alpha/beta hydrolase family esterase [Cytophagales bacterium]|tara:strand:- start:4188 stop:5162 length:975 start_codon:yes stop_codon:yes gene_type:complete